jgi:hypothetical protein
MRRLLKELGVELAGNTVYDLLRVAILGVVAISASAAVSTSLSTYVRPLRPLRWPLLFLLVSLGLWIFLALYGRWSRSRPKFEPLDFDFALVKHEITYIYRADQSVQYRRKKVLRALKRNLNTYIDKYHWTGSGKDEMRSAIAGQEVRRTRKRSIWQMYEIEFPTLQKGQVVETEVVWDLEDITDSVVPFISATVEEPTEQLTFRLRFAPEIGVTQVWCEILSGIGGKNSFNTDSIPVSSTGDVEWSPAFPHPKLLHHYEVTWRFPNRSKNP